MGNRRRSRELALQTLYALDRTKGQADSGMVDEAISHMKTWTQDDTDEAEDAPAPTESNTDINAFAEKLVRGVIANMQSIDNVIGEYSTNWKVPRMALVDRNVLRLAAFELIHMNEIPPRVTLNEAIEVAKRYGSKDSGAFINGILDRVAALKKNASEKKH